MGVSGHWAGSWLEWEQPGRRRAFTPHPVLKRSSLSISVGLALCLARCGSTKPRSWPLPSRSLHPVGSSILATRKPEHQGVNQSGVFSCKKHDPWRENIACFLTSESTSFKCYFLKCCFLKYMWCVCMPELTLTVDFLIAKFYSLSKLKSFPFVLLLVPLS